MAWNEPGGDKKDPWGKNDGPPDLDEVFMKFQKKLKGLFGGDNNHSSPGNVGFSIGLVLFIAGIVYVASGFYIIEPAEEAVVTRFGKFDRTVQPGPHWLPRFIERKHVVPRERILSSRHAGTMLTKDENIITLEIEVQYRIENIQDYLFNIVGAERSLKQATESALRQVVGHNTLDFIMTLGKTELAHAIQETLAATLDSYQSGIHIVTVAYKDARVPAEVKSAFDNVIKAQEYREQLKHKAEAYANKIVGEAKGEAEKLIVDATAYKEAKIMKANGQTARFNLILPEYQRAPHVTKKRLYLETMQNVLSQTSKILVDGDSGQNLMYLPIDKWMTQTNQEKKAEDIFDAGSESQAELTEQTSPVAKRRRG